MIKLKNMRKIFFVIIAILGFTTLQAQGFGIGLSGGFLSELDGIGGTADLIYELDEHWGVSTSYTFATRDDTGVRAKWNVIDLNARYVVYDEFYLLAGGEYLKINLKQLGLSGGNPVGGDQVADASEYGANAGVGYKYNLVDNVNLFAEMKYAFVDAGYVHGKFGIRFDF
jgi:opacity protein-like surface antigen